jgi:hypothetical protein
MMQRHAMTLCILMWAAHAQAQSLVVAQELWDRPRSARAVLDEAAVKQAVTAYLAQRGSRIVIHHGAAQESMLQAEELRSWLIALAVESQHIGLLGDLKPGEALRMAVRR